MARARCLREPGTSARFQCPCCHLLAARLRTTPMRNGQGRWRCHNLAGSGDEAVFILTTRRPRRVTIGRMDAVDGSLKALRLGRDGATTLLAGALLSGVISQVLVAGVHPARPWQDARDFASHYRAIEALPFFYGFALIAGGVMVIVACHRIATAAEQTRTLMALLAT